MQTVKRGAGRPAATAKRTKAAQHTPLPPRAGVVDAAGEAIRVATARVREKASAETRRDELTSMPLVELRALARSTGMLVNRTTKKAAMIEHIEEAEAATAAELLAKAARVASVNAARPAKARRSAVDEVAPTKSRQGMGTRLKAKAQAPAKKATSRGQETRKAPAAVVGMPSAAGKSEAKADALIAEAKKLGWYGNRETKDDITTAVLTRGDEIITIQWDSGVFIGETCNYSFGGRTIKIHNASAARKRMAMPPEAAEAERSRVAVNRSFSHRATVTSPREHRQHKLPFSEASLDDEVLAALNGKRIYWVNSISQVVEDDVIPSLRQTTRGRDGAPIDTRQTHQPHITEGTHDGRIVNFVGNTGFRSVRLSAIIRVR